MQTKGRHSGAHTLWALRTYVFSQGPVIEGPGSMVTEEELREVK